MHPRRAQNLKKRSLVRRKAACRDEIEYLAGLGIFNAVRGRGRAREEKRKGLKVKSECKGKVEGKARKGKEGKLISVGGNWFGLSWTWPLDYFRALAMPVAFTRGNGVVVFVGGSGYVATWLVVNGTSGTNGLKPWV